MSDMTDEELLQELKNRFDSNKQALYDLKILTKKLEDLNAKLQDSEEVKSHFLSNVKNEINNPLTSILGLSQQLTSSRSPEMVNTISEMIHKEAFVLDFQLRNLFAAAELESGETQLGIAQVEVKPLIKALVESFKYPIKGKKLGVYFAQDPKPESGEDEIPFKTDPEKLHMIVINLLSNAIEYNFEGGRVEIKAGIVDDNLTISVRDTGAGIEEAMVPKVFDRFHQLSSGLTKSHLGQGLGLSIVKAAVELMDGEVVVDSTIGEGSTFTVSIPQVEVDVEADAFAVDGNEFLFDDDDVEAF